MTDHNLLLQLVPQRIEKILSRLNSNCWQKERDLSPLGGQVNAMPVSLSDAMRQKMHAVVPGEYFGPVGKNASTDRGAWQQRWFKVVFPAARAHERGRRFFFWDCRGEHTIYFKNSPYAGIDVAHLFCKLPDSGGTFWIDAALYQTAVWFPGKTPDEYGCKFDGAWIALRDESAWNAYWDWDVLCSLVKQLLSKANWHPGAIWSYKASLENTDPLLRQLLGAMNRACDVYESGRGLAAFVRAVKGIYSKFTAQDWSLRQTCVGHSHLDLVWYWPENEGYRKGIHTAASMLHLLEQYPEFKYMWTQPALYDVFEKQSPSLFRGIKRQMQKGRWEATGGMWVEADNTLPCGEALARSLYLGQRYFKKMRGDYSTVVCLPDVFGYSVCLPKLMSLAGIKAFYTSKISWSVVNKFPYDSFTWKSPGSGEVLAHLYSHPDKYKQADVFEECIQLVGVGDGGGGTTVEDLERARRLKNLAGMPRQDWGTMEGFFDRLSKVKSQLPVYQGELYLEYHRGTLTTQSEFKRQYRRAETGMQILEAARVVLAGKPVAVEDWQRICYAQFHDAIPGSSIKLVYDEMTPVLESIADTAFVAAQKELSCRQGTASVFNPCPVARRVAIEYSGKPGKKAQVIGKGRVLSVVDIEGLGLRTIASMLEEDAALPVKVSDASLDNGIVRAQFDNMSRLCALQVDGADLLAGPCQLMLYPDDPAHYDAWDIDQYSLFLGRPLPKPDVLKVKENGPIRGILECSGSVGDKSSYKLRFILEAGSPWLRLEMEIDWQESHSLLRYQCPTPFQGAHALFGAPFNSIQRPQLPGELKSEAMWEVPASRWASVLDGCGSNGFAIVTEAKYGFSCRSGVMGLSLLRAPKHPDPDADIGRHCMCFALGRHSCVVLPERETPALAADTLFTPVVMCKNLERQPPFVIDDIGSLVSSWVLPNADGKGYIIRFHETMGMGGCAKVRFAKQPSSVVSVDLLNRPLKKIRCLAGAYKVCYEPYDILSVLVE